MRNIKLTLEYDGTGYSGWQSQRRGEPTVQSALEEAVERLTGRSSRVVGAGRTDAGVHALGQVACFRTASALEAETMGRALNAMLPPDIRVRAARDAHASFHAQWSATWKSYFYVIANMEQVSPFLERYVWKVPQRLNLPRMRAAARHLLGRHDFAAFRASGSSAKTSEREIRSLSVTESRGMPFLGAKLQGRFIRVRVEGSGFLRHMVRNIVGTLVEVGRGKLPPEAVAGIMASRDRRTAGPTAPAKGLFLEKVRY
jgi:tRNA pseudouridine38-40 synthase